MRGTEIYWGDIPVGPNNPPVFLAEIGTFFNQDLGQARAMAERIYEASRGVGIPVVLKGEILHSFDICLDDATVETYASKAGEIKQERYRDLIERKVVPLERYREFFGVCTRQGMPFVLSVYDLVGADFAKEVGAVAIKIASANVSHVPLIRYVAAQGLPMLIDTGRATLEEVARAVQTARAAGCHAIVVEHSPDGHPALPENHNLRLLQSYAHAFEVAVGLSDHHVGEEMLYLAIGLGASVLEKGVCLEPEALEQDVAHAMGLDELPRILTRIHNCWRALGRGLRDPAVPIRGVVATSQRQGLIARGALKPGDILSFETVAFAWPCKGIPVHQWDVVAGWEVTVSRPKGAIIDWTHVRPVSS